MINKKMRQSRLISLTVVSCAALALIGATRAPAPNPITEPTSAHTGGDHAATNELSRLKSRSISSRSGSILRPGSITSRDIGSGAILARHLSRSTVPTFIGAGPSAQRPRAVPSTNGWLYFADDVDGGALFRSNGRTWDQLTTGRLGRIARNSIDSSRIRPKGVNSSRIADRSITANKMTMSAWRAISSSGTMAGRPNADARPAGAFYFASDEQGGTLFQNNGSQWVVVNRIGAAANIADGAISTNMLADGAVTTPKLAAGAITGAQLSANAVTNSTIQAGAVDSTSIMDNAIGTAKIANDAVTTAKIVDNAITSTKIASGVVNLSHIDSAVWSNRLATGPIVSRPAADPANADSLYFAPDEAGGTLSRSDGSTWSVVGRTRSPRTIGFLFGVWTNMPAALSEMYGGNRVRVPADLSTATEIRMFTNVLTVGSGSICAHYSIDAGATWTNFDGSAGTTCVAGVARVAITATGLQASPWISIPAEAQDENTLLRLATIGGNGALDPNFGVTAVEVR